MARKNRDDFTTLNKKDEPTVCALCDRIIPEDQVEEHHLVPKSKGGKVKVPLHRICHSQIHSVFTDAQLAKKFSTIAAILDEPAMRKFVDWVKGKPPEFADEAREATRRR